MKSSSTNIGYPLGEVGHTRPNACHKHNSKHKNKQPEPPLPPLVFLLAFKGASRCNATSACHPSSQYSAGASGHYIGDASSVSSDPIDSCLVILSFVCTYHVYSADSADCAPSDPAVRSA